MSAPFVGHPGKRGCPKCGGKGVTLGDFVDGDDGFRMRPCPACFPPPLVEGGTEDPGAFTADAWRRAHNRREFLDTLVEDAAFLDAGVRLRAALDAVRAARQDGEA